MAQVMLTCKEYAERMNLHEISVRRMCERGELGAKKLGTRWRIPFDEEETPIAVDMQAEAARDLLASLKSACATVSTAVAEYEAATKA